MNCYTHKKKFNLTKKAVTNKSTSPLMWLIKIVTEALGSTHSRRQLKIYVICKAESEERKNKSEFVFLKRRLTWVFCNGYKVQFSSLLFCRWSLNTETKKGILRIVKKKKKKAKNRAGCHIGLFRSGPTLLAWQSLQGLETERCFKQSMRRLVQVIVSCPKSKLLFCGSWVYLCMNPMQRPTDRLTIFLFRQVKKSTLLQIWKRKIQINVLICAVRLFYLLCILTRPDILYV